MSGMIVKYLEKSAIHNRRGHARLKVNKKASANWSAGVANGQRQPHNLRHRRR